MTAQSPVPGPKKAAIGYAWKMRGTECQRALEEARKPDQKRVVDAFKKVFAMKVPDGFGYVLAT